MRWLKLLLLVPVLAGTALACMLILFPDAGWVEDVRLPVAAVVLACGAWAAVGLIESRERPKWTPEQQLEHARLLVDEDARWMAHSLIVSELTERYLSALSPGWQSASFEPTNILRQRLNLDPHTRRATPPCEVPPPGWLCTRAKGHDGPCAAWPEESQQ